MQLLPTLLMFFFPAYFQFNLYFGKDSSFRKDS